MQTLGVDVARGAWIAVVLEDGRFADAAVEGVFDALIARFPDAAVVGVDVPIGLPDPGVRRRADVDARVMVGPRRASVFMTPPLAVLSQPTYPRAREVAPSTSAQAWAIGRAILEVERSADERVREVHPEVSFAALAGQSLADGKKTWNGQHERTALLRRAGIEIPRQLEAAGLVAADDVLDAAVVAWTATRIARAEHRTLPADPEPGEAVIHY
jgi:predicted RNase H-like nuclease